MAPQSQETGSFPKTFLLKNCFCLSASHHTVGSEIRDPPPWGLRGGSLEGGSPEAKLQGKFWKQRVP